MPPLFIRPHMPAAIELYVDILPAVSGRPEGRQMKLHLTFTAALHPSLLNHSGLNRPEFRRFGELLTLS